MGRFSTLYRRVRAYSRRLARARYGYCALSIISLLTAALFQPSALLPVVVTLLVGGVLLVRVDAARREIVNEVRKSRSAASRHEWLIESALDRHDTLADQIYALSRSQVTPRRPTDNSSQGTPFLFVTSNGFGLGHITRCLAIARRLPASQAQIVTLSVGYQAVQDSSVPVHYFASRDTSGLPPRVWNDRFQEHLEAIMISSGTEVLIFDGPVVYPAVTRAARVHNASLVWLRRDLWQITADRTQYDQPERICDYLVVPGEAVGHVDAPTFVRSRLIPPITIRSDTSATRTASLAQLGLAPTKRYYLLQLGSTSVTDVSELAQFIVDQMRHLLPGYEPVMFNSAVTRQAQVQGIRTITDFYPMADVLEAFDFAVIAAGYNAVHEVLAAHLPSIVIPNPLSQTDDQLLRARLLTEQGLALFATNREELLSALERISQEAVRTRMTTHIEESLIPFDGALQSAQYLEHVLSIRSTRLQDRTSPLQSLGGNHGAFTPSHR